MIRLTINKRYLTLLILSVPAVLYLGTTNNKQFVQINGYDKILHFTIFFIETVLFNKSIEIFQFKNHHFDLNRHHLNFVVCFVLGCIGSEFLQHFVNSNRTFDLFDIMANLCGSILGYILTFFF